MGKAVEHLVAASCILATRGALNVSTALVDDEGVDLVFHRRGGTRTLAVQVKSRMSDSAGITRGLIRAYVRQRTFRPRSDLYILYVPVDITTGSFEKAWLVPSQEFENRSANRRGRLVFSASLKPGTQDQWSRFRVSQE
jgi:hypothetical protein